MCYQTMSTSNEDAIRQSYGSVRLNYDRIWLSYFNCRLVLIKTKEEATFIIHRTARNTLQLTGRLILIKRIYFSQIRKTYAVFILFLFINRISDGRNETQQTDMQAYTRKISGNIGLQGPQPGSRQVLTYCNFIAITQIQLS